MGWLIERFRGIVKQVWEPGGRTQGGHERPLPIPIQRVSLAALSSRGRGELLSLFQFVQVHCWDYSSAQRAVANR